MKIPWEGKRKIGWWRDGEDNHLVLYHGTHIRHVPEILKSGINKPDPNTGLISTTPDPHTAHGYASMSGEHDFRAAGKKAVHVPHEDRAVIKLKIPHAWANRHMDHSLSGNMGSTLEKMRDRTKYGTQPDSEYYATSEVRFNRAIPKKFVSGYMQKKEKAITEMYQYLEEKLAINSFTFGFELEAIYRPRAGVEDEDKLIDLDKEVVEKRIKALEPILGLKAKFGGSYMRDGSVKGSHGHDTPFEYVSGVLKFNDSNIRSFTEMMKSITSKGVYTNSSCGFHIHFGFPDTTRKQLLWIKLVYIFDTLAQSHFEYFQSTQGTIPFWSAKYASVGNKKKIAADLAKLIKDFKVNPNAKGMEARVNKFFSQDYFTSKYNVLGIHEKYRTLEWRGPRGFLATGDQQDIVNFVSTVRKFVAWLSNAEDVERIVVDPARGIYINKEDFFNMVEHHSPQKVSRFGVDIADQIDATQGDKKKAEIAFDYFQKMDFSSRAATNYRKIANRIKNRYPKAWEIFLKRVNAERTFPEKAKVWIMDLARKLHHLHEEEMREAGLMMTFRDYVSIPELLD
jgi:hypothetical protein